MEQGGGANNFSDAQARGRLAAIVDSSDDAIISKTLEGIVTSWNRGAERLYGYAAEEAVGRSIAFIIPPERLQELSELHGKIRAGQRVENLETVRITKSGRMVDVNLTVSPILSEDGSVTGISAIGRDITRQKEMERSLRESEKRYRTLVEMAPDAVLVCQEDRIVFANCAALTMVRAESPTALEGLSLVDLIHPDEQERVRARIRQLLQGEQGEPREYRLRARDGSDLFVEANSILIEYQGKPAIQVMGRDITERKQAELERERMLKQLDFERGRFEAMVRQMPVGVMIAESPSGRLIYENEHSKRIFRTEAPGVESIADYGVWQLFRPDGTRVPVEEYPMARAVLGETVVDEEILITRGNGTRCFLYVNAAPIFSGEGCIVAGLAAFNDVTEKKEALQALADSEERLNLALDAAEMGSCDMELPSGRGVWSRRHFLLLGYPPPEASSAPAEVRMWQELIVAEDREAVLHEFGQAKQERRIFRSEHRVTRVDNGKALWVSVQGRFICNEEGPPCRFIGVIFDITERKAADEALKRSEQRFRLMIDSMPQVAWVAEPDGCIEYLNAHFEAYSGIERAATEILANLAHPENLISLLVHPDDVTRSVEAWQRSMRTGAIYETESRIRRHDGAFRWHLSRAVPERNEQGGVVKWYGTATDIHDLREAQEKLRASETRFRRLYDSNLIAIFFWNKDGRIIEANQAFCDILGCSIDDCTKLELNWVEATPPEYLPRDYQAIREAAEEVICKAYEKHFINRVNGRLVPVLTAVARMEGTEAEGIAFAVDLTELKRTEEALRNSEAALKLAVEITELGIFDMDPRTGRGIWTDIAKKHYGFPPDVEVDLDLLMAAVHPDDRPYLQQIASEAAQPGGAGVYSAEYRTVGAVDGKERWLTMRARQLRDDQGTPLRLLGACLDITGIVRAERALKEEISERLRAVEELRRQEQLLIRQGRLAAMGEMIGNIAHQWRQPLNTLGLIVQELPRYYERNLFSKEYLEGSVARAMQVINYMSKTIDGFRNFFGPDKEKQQFRAAEVLARTVSIVEAAFDELNLKIEVHADDNVSIFGCPNEFSQVILNILVNAKDALFERKTARPKVEVRLFREEGKVVLTIADNAGGIAPEIMEKIFDPYFTTKEPDKGTGIGLFMSKTIIEKNMNGTLTVRNTGEGAEFRIEV